ncbi:hypothetical protein [Glaciimonas soli]|nr:hypothetical protein [Glaciimonas soli]
MTRIPKDVIESVLELAEAATTQENRVRTAILEDVDPQEAYLKYDKF